MPGERKIVFFGTGGLALPALEELSEAGYLPDLLVVHSRRSGDEESPGDDDPPVLAWAEEHAVETRRPANPGAPAFLELLGDREPDLGVVVDFGRKLPEAVLDVPELACVKLHFSRLPKYRGPNPIRNALMNGEKKTGVTVIRMEEELDAGPILLQEEIEIGEEETYGELAPRLAEAGAPLLVEAVEHVGPAPVKGKRGRKGKTGKKKAAAPKGVKKLKERKQNERSASQSTRFTKRHRSAPWWLEAGDVFNRLRACLPDSGLYTFIKRRKIEVLWGKPMNWVQAPFGTTGSFLGVRTGKLAILCGGSTVFGIERVRWGGDEIDAMDFARQTDLRVADQFV